MAFFKFRKGAADSKGAPPQPPSLDSIRRRAKYRLLGASVLVLAGVIVFPLVLDSQPRPIAVNTPIDIPDKNKVAPLQLPSASAARARVAASDANPVVSVPAAPVAVVAPAVPGREPIITEAAPTSKDSTPKVPLDPSTKALDAPKDAVSSVAKAASAAAISAPKPDLALPAKPLSSGPVPSKPPAKPASAPAKPASAAVKPASAATSDAARARALLEGVAAKPVPAGGASAVVPTDAPASAPSDARFVVQVGAFAEAARAQEVRLKVERAGMKTYTHVAETKDGRRIRVRVGPFSKKDDAEKAAAKIKTLDLPAAVLTL